MSWTTPVLDWLASHIPGASDFNRIEGNTLDNHERLEDIMDGSSRIPRAWYNDLFIVEAGNENNYPLIYFSGSNNTMSENVWFKFRNDAKNYGLAGKINARLSIRMSSSVANRNGYARVKKNGEQILYVQADLNNPRTFRTVEAIINIAPGDIFTFEWRRAGTAVQNGVEVTCGFYAKTWPVIE